MHLVGFDGLGQSIHDELSCHVQREVWGREALDGFDVGTGVATAEGNIDKDRTRVEREMVWDDGLSTTGRRVERRRGHADGRQTADRTRVKGKDKRCGGGGRG